MTYYKMERTHKSLGKQLGEKWKNYRTARAIARTLPPTRNALELTNMATQVHAQYGDQLPESTSQIKYDMAERIRQQMVSY